MERENTNIPDMKTLLPGSAETPTATAVDDHPLQLTAEVLEPPHTHTPPRQQNLPTWTVCVD